MILSHKYFNYYTLMEIAMKKIILAISSILSIQTYCIEQPQTTAQKALHILHI